MQQHYLFLSADLSSCIDLTSLQKLLDGLFLLPFPHIVFALISIQVSVLILQSYEPPVLACALDVVLSHISGERSASSSKAKPTLVVPSVITSSKLKWESKTVTKNDRTGLLYGTEVGPETDISRSMGAKVKKLPSTSQIYYEQLACLYRLIQILNIPAFFVVGRTTGRSLSNQAAGEEIQVLIRSIILYY